MNYFLKLFKLLIRYKSISVKLIFYNKVAKRDFYNLIRTLKLFISLKVINYKNKNIHF